MSDIPRFDPAFPDRPQSNAFWALSELVRELDAEADKDPGFDHLTQEVESMGITISDLSYMALNRLAMAEALPEEYMPAGIAIWVEAFTIGYNFRQRQRQVTLPDGTHRQAQNQATEKKV